MSARAGVVVIDGYCGVCARSADLLVRLDRRAHLTIVPSQELGALDRYGLTPGQVAASVWFLPRPADGGRGGGRTARPVGGARAVGAALDTALGIRLFEPIAGAPLLGRVIERGYRWVAANRRRLPGATPWCHRVDTCAEPA
ncbi:putative DCC family thiol-disulfide oxidoreductase YuxK [Salana multivorans]|uniref:Putative DCC family thiol-disulfide oxidoreductase YuxK n=1 Tax=Salana multivorans TaxID=120377 RepID=A0A3N2DAZ7_9MICO|nr:DCC1-like thiol-disulfide oxidoreductase family protein [Salana multivorans]ROR96828.1 putative DCC family thiol-disulfide oxidoreductase YuxK [Salana multivorans]